MMGFHRAGSTPTTPEPSGTTIEVPIPHCEQSKAAQNYRIVFMLDFEPKDEINDFDDIPYTPMSASEGDTPTNQAIPDTGISSHGWQCKMSKEMTESVSQCDFYGNRDMYYTSTQGTINRQPEADLFHYLHLEEIPLHFMQR